MFVESEALRRKLKENQLCWRIKSLPARYARKDSVTGELSAYLDPVTGKTATSLPPRLKVDVMYRPTMEVVHILVEAGVKDDDGERAVGNAVDAAVELVGKGAMKTPAQLAQENEQLRSRLKELGGGAVEQEPGERMPTGPEVQEIQDRLRDMGIKIPPGPKSGKWYKRCQNLVEQAEEAADEMDADEEAGVDSPPEPATMTATEPVTVP